MSSGTQQAHPSVPDANNRTTFRDSPNAPSGSCGDPLNTIRFILLLRKTHQWEGLLPHRRASDVLNMNEKALTSGIVAFPKTGRYK